MNYEIKLNNLILDDYPNLDNCLLNVSIIHYYKNSPKLKPVHYFDSDWDSSPYVEIDFELMWGETKRKDNKIVPLSAHQLDEIAEAYGGEIEKMLLDIVGEDKEGWYE